MGSFPGVGILVGGWHLVMQTTAGRIMPYSVLSQLKGFSESLAFFHATHACRNCSAIPVLFWGIENSGRLPEPHPSVHVYSHFLSTSCHFLRALSGKHDPSPGLLLLWPPTVGLTVCPALGRWDRAQGLPLWNPPMLALPLFPPRQGNLCCSLIVGKLSHYSPKYLVCYSIYLCSPVKLI